MSKADECTTPIRSRRAVLTGIGAAVALPIAAALPVAALAVTPDEALISLGHQFDGMVKHINEAGSHADKLYEPVHDAIEAQACWPTDQRQWSHDDARRYCETKWRIVDEIGAEWVAANDRYEQAHEPSDRLSYAIWAIPTQSVSGLAVKAKAAALANSELWDKPFHDLDWGPKSTAALIEASFAAASLPTPADYLGSGGEDSRPSRPNVMPFAVAVDPVIVVAERAIAAWNDFEEKCLVTSRAEELVIDWKNANPRPGLRPHIVGSNEDYVAFQAGRSTYDPSADLDAAIKEQEAAVREWGKSKRAVEKKAGYTRAERVQKLASERVGEIMDELCNLRPVSIPGLRAKARVARFTGDEDLQQEIVHDIGALFGDVAAS